MMHRIVLVGVILCIVPVMAQAETVVRTGDTVSITTEQQVINDFYAAGMSVVQSGLVAGDMYSIANTVTNNGQVEADVTAVAARVTIEGSVADDVRTLAGETVIAGEVGGDVFVLGGTLHILSTATIAGDVYLFGGEGIIEGTVAGAVRGYTERMRIDAPIGGSVDLTVRQGMSLGSRADIVGDVTIRTDRQIARAPEAQIGGSLLTHNIEPTTSPNSLRDMVVPALVMLFGSLVLYLLGRQFMSLVVATALRKTILSSLIGLTVAFAGPILSLFLIATVLGLVIGLGSLGLYLVFMTLSYSIAPMVVGVFLWSLFGGTQTLQPFAILLGVVVIQMLLFVPTIGAIMVGFLCIIAVGALVDTTVRHVAARV